jgi:methylthioribose-1-phosphate isomerase
MAGHFISRGEVDGIVVGADRIAANGDTANKIGTYTLSVLAKEHGVPFYVAAPLSTVDRSVASGADIPIEERDPGEVTSFRGVQVAPVGAHARHPAFDITPQAGISAIVTEVGVLRPPFDKALRRACLEGTCG